MAVPAISEPEPHELHHRGPGPPRDSLVAQDVQGPGVQDWDDEVSLDWAMSDLFLPVHGDDMLEGFRAQRWVLPRGDVGREEVVPPEDDPRRVGPCPCTVHGGLDVGASRVVDASVSAQRGNRLSGTVAHRRAAHAVLLVGGGRGFQLAVDIAGDGNVSLAVGTGRQHVHAEVEGGVRLELHGEQGHRRTGRVHETRPCLLGLRACVHEHRQFGPPGKLDIQDAVARVQTTGIRGRGPHVSGRKAPVDEQADTHGLVRGITSRHGLPVERPFHCHARRVVRIQVEDERRVDAFAGPSRDFPDTVLRDRHTPRVADVAEIGGVRVGRIHDHQDVPVVEQTEGGVGEGEPDPGHIVSTGHADPGDPLGLENAGFYGGCGHEEQIIGRQVSRVQFVGPHRVRSCVTR